MITRGVAGMNMRLIDKGSDASEGVGLASRMLRRMSPEQFLNLGVQQVVYVRAGIRDGSPFFLIFGADGIPLATVETLQDAVQRVVEQGFEFATVH